MSSGDVLPASTVAAPAVVLPLTSGASVFQSIVIATVAVVVAVVAVRIVKMVVTAR